MPEVGAQCAGGEDRRGGQRSGQGQREPHRDFGVYLMR